MAPLRGARQRRCAIDRDEEARCLAGVGNRTIDLQVGHVHSQRVAKTDGAIDRPAHRGADGRQQRLEVGLLRDIKRLHVGRRRRLVAMHRQHLDVARVVIDGHQPVRAAGCQAADLRVGVEHDLLPDEGPQGRTGNDDVRPVEDADAADVAQRRHHAGIERNVALELAVVDGVPAAVEALHAARVAALHHDRAHHAALREQHARAHLDDLVRSAAHRHVEADLRDPRHVDVVGRVKAPAAERAETVAREVGLMQRHLRFERRVDHRRNRRGEHVRQAVGQRVGRHRDADHQVVGLQHATGHAAIRRQRLRRCAEPGQARNGAGGDEPQLNCRAQAAVGGVAERRLVQQRLQAAAQVAPREPFQANERAQTERKREQCGRRPGALRRLDDLCPDPPREHRHHSLGARADQADAALAARQHLLPVRRLRGGIWNHVHRLPMNLRLHQQAHMAQRDGEPVVRIDLRRQVGHRFERDTKQVVAARQVDQRKLRCGGFEMGVEGDPKTLAFVGGDLAREREPGLRLELGAQRWRDIGLPAKRRAECRLGELEVEVAHAPVRGVRVGQGRLRQAHIEHQPGRALLRVHRAAAAADEGHAPRRVHVQVKVLERKALHRLAVKLGRRGSARDAPQAVGLGDQREHLRHAFEPEGLPAGRTRQIPQIADLPTLQRRDIGATAPAGVAQAAELIGAEANPAARRAPEHHVGRDAGARAPTLHFQPMGIRAEHGVAPRAGTAGAGQPACRAVAQQHADRPAVSGFAGLRHIGARHRQRPDGAHHTDRVALDTEHRRAVGFDRPGGGADVEGEPDRLGAGDRRAGLRLEAQVAAETGQPESPFDDGRLAAAQAEARWQQDGQRIGIRTAGRSGWGGFGLDLQRPRHGDRNVQAAVRRQLRHAVEEQRAARDAQGHEARSVGRQMPGQQPHRAGRDAEAPRIVRLDASAGGQQHRDLLHVDELQHHGDAQELRRLEEAELHQREVGVDERAEHLRRHFGGRLFCKVRLLNEAQANAFGVERRGQCGACRRGVVDLRAQSRVHGHRDEARVLLDQCRGKEAA